MDLKADLLSRADAFCKATGMSKPRLATIVANDGKFFARIERGGDFTAGMYERFLAYFAANAPAAEPAERALLSTPDETFSKPEAAE